MVYDIWISEFVGRDKDLITLEKISPFTKKERKN